MTDTTKVTKRGRKPARQQSATDRLHLRAPPDDKAKWEAAAASDGKSLSSWAIDALNDKASKR